MRASFLVMCLGLAPIATRADEGWQRVTVRDGVTVDRRPVPGSKIYETRATASTKVAPAQLFRVLWDRRAYKEFVPYVKHEDILAETATELLVYDQVRVPLVADRDYVVRIRGVVDPSTQVHLIEFFSDDSAGPPQAKDHIRVRNIRGGWELRPSASGGTDITYWMHSDPGGSIPAWIVNLVQKREVPKYIRLMLDRASQQAARH